MNARYLIAIMCLGLSSGLSQIAHAAEGSKTDAVFSATMPQSNSNAQAAVEAAVADKPTNDEPTGNAISRQPAGFDSVDEDGSFITMSTDDEGNVTIVTSQPTASDGSQTTTTKMTDKKGVPVSDITEVKSADGTTTKVSRSTNGLSITSSLTTVTDKNGKKVLHIYMDTIQGKDGSVIIVYEERDYKSRTIKRITTVYNPKTLKTTITTELLDNVKDM